MRHVPPSPIHPQPIRYLTQAAQSFIVDIDSIQAHGIGAADITKLKANGFYTVTVSISQVE